MVETFQPKDFPAIRAVIFDCDGTLVDSEEISLKVLVDLVAQQGLVFPHDQAVRDWAGRDLHVVLQEIEAQLGRKLPERFLDTFREHQLAKLAESVTPVSGAGPLLAGMRKPFCVASNAPQNKIRLCLETTGLLPFVDSERIFSAYDVRAWKPRPDLFLHAAKQMGVSSSACAVVEDSGVGLDAGLAAGMHVLGYDPHGRLPSRDGVTVFHHLDELRPIFHTA